MSYFQTLDGATRPVRIALIGAGAMGRQWLALLDGHPEVDLVGIVDLDLASAAEAQSSVTSTGTVVVGESLQDILSRTPVDAIVNVTVPDAHYSVNTEALTLGVSVLCEKPVAPTVEQAMRMAATAQLSERLLMTSQSRRYYGTLQRFRDSVATLGNIGVVTASFHRGPKFGGFRDRMEHPLLLDMAIHAFDCARYLLGREPVSVYCEEFNPPWSWYDGDAATIAVFEMEHGIRFVYDGSWCNEGLSTSWNGHWIVRGEHGSASWDGASHPSLDAPAAIEASDSDTGVDVCTSPEEIAGSLAEFINSLRTGEVPSGDIHSNIWTLAMVEAAVTSATTGQRVGIQTLVGAAFQEALANAETALVATALSCWGGLGQPSDAQQPGVPAH